MPEEFLFGQLIAAGLRVIGATQGSILLPDPEGRNLRFVLTADQDGSPVLRGDSNSPHGQMVPIGEGITGMAALTHDVQASSVTGGGRFLRVRGDGNPTAVLAAPLLMDDRLLGVLTAVSFDPRKTFSTEDARAYGIFANLAASLLAQSPNPPLSSVQPSDEERLLLSDVLDFVRRKSGRCQALRELLSCLERIP